MNKYKTLIIEDNLPFAIKIEKHLVEWGHQVLGIIDNSKEALEVIKTQEPDLIIIDINIKGQLNGVEIAHSIKNLKIPVIFITGRKDEQIYKEAQSTTGISYLVKPFDMKTLQGVIDFALPERKTGQQEKSDEQYFYIKKNNQLLKIDKTQISWLKADGNYCDFYIGTAKYTVRMSLKKVLAKLPKKEFLKIHKSHAVRISDIDGIFLSKNQIRVGEVYLPLGRNFREELLQRVKQLE